MGLIAVLKSFTRTVRNSANVSDARLDPGGAPLVTAQHFAPPGDDSNPLPGDYAYAGGVTQSGRCVVLGYVDPATTPAALPGEKRLYSREGDGVLAASIWLKADGAVVIANDIGNVTLSASGAILGQNAAGSFELGADGTFTVNGVTIDPSGNITTPGSLEANVIKDTATNVTVSTHNHGGPPPVPGT